MKNLIIFFPLIISTFCALAQNVRFVIHKDLLLQKTKNETVKVANLGFYNNTLGTIKETRNTVLNAVTSVELIHQKVFNALTNVSSGIKNVKTLAYISQYALSTLTNVGRAFSLAASKPYLIEIVSKEAIVFYERVANLTAFVSNFILNENIDFLIKPTERDRLLFKVYHEMLILDAISGNLCDKLKKWKLEDAVYHIVPINQYVNTDIRLINNILKGWNY